EYRRNYLCVRLYLITSFLLFIEAAYYLYFLAFENVLLISGQALLYVFLIYLFYKGKMLLAKNITFLLTNIMVFCIASLFGRAAYQHLILIPLIIGSVFFYSDREFKYMLSALVLSVTNLVVLELTDYQLLKGIILSEMVFRFDGLIVVMMTLGCSFYMLYELMSMNINMEEKLKRLNGSLQIRNGKLRTSNDDLDSFVYRASHDLRSPLSSIMGVINIVKTEKDVTKIKEYMKYQERSVKKLDDLIQDILDLSRNAKLDIFIEPVDLKLFIKSCVESFSYMEEFKKVHILIDVPDGFIVNTDTRRLKVILNNLLSNALRYCDSEKEQSYFKIRGEYKQQNIALTFEDNGIGIQKEHLDKVFNMFYRATNQNTGSGLGLYIVKDAIDKLDGVIKIEAVFGEGTSIQVLIPKREKQLEIVIS
ncbi:MAG: rcsC, partial [Chitinophagaceae bacterium]|nr:rcsC [Chitinophagaceae bacterium]